MKYCSNCGNKIKKESSFCTRCGNDLREETINETISEPVLESANDTPNDYIDETANVPIVPTNESISEPVNETISDPTSDSTNEPISEPISALINESGSDQVVNSITISPDENLKSNLKSSKKVKALVLLFTVVLILVVAFINVCNSLTDPNKLVSRFEKDVASNNASDLVHILYTNDAKLKVDSQSIAPLLSSFKSNPTYYNKVIEDLKNDAIIPKSINDLNITTSNILTLTSKENFMLFLHNYKIIIKPCFVDITTAVKDVTFSINGTQIGKSYTDKFSKKFGPYIPGNYSISAKYKGKYVTLDKLYHLNLVSNNNGITKLNVLNNMKYLNIFSDYSNAEIFVDGKDANVKVKDARRFGPIDSSSKIYATYVAGGISLKSEEYSVSNEDTELYLIFQDYTTYGNNVRY